LNRNGPRSALVGFPHSYLAIDSQKYRKSVWPPAEKVADQADVIPEGISAEEVTNQRAYGSHASNSKGRIVHLKNCESLVNTCSIE
jgi:hypothetical protein